MYKFFFILFIFSNTYSIFAKCLSGDCQNGVGVDIDPNNNTKYEGQFQNGKKNGKGKLTDSAGNIYSGEWVDEEPVKGIYKFKNGDKYSGKLKDRMFHGVGVMIYANGDRYSGEFKKDKKSGTGTQVFKSQRKVYVGKWKNDKQHGKGKIYYYTDSESGKFVNGNKVPN